MSEPDIQRRLLLGCAVGALALRPSRTKADTSFTNFSFAATGAPAAHTMPDRLSDIVNVKDWGALGLGGDYTSQIQAAINYAIGPRPDGTIGGTVFFPAGGYKTHNLIVGSDTVI
jgi:polygalacturonase